MSGFIRRAYELSNQSAAPRELRDLSIVLLTALKVTPFGHTRGVGSLKSALNFGLDNHVVSGPLKNHGCPE